MTYTKSDTGTDPLVHRDSCSLTIGFHVHTLLDAGMCSNSSPQLSLCLHKHTVAPHVCTNQHKFTHTLSAVHIEANTDSQITVNMLLSAHKSAHAAMHRPSYLSLTARHSSPLTPTPASCLPPLAGEGGEGLGRLGAWLSPCSLPVLAGSLPPIWQSQAAQPGSGSPGCSGQTLGGLVSADGTAAAEAAAAGARRLRAAANVADGGQGGRKEAGPILRPLAGGDKTKGAG